MRNIVKKVAVYSMIGMMQVGFGVSVIEASPVHNNSAPASQQSDRSETSQNRPYDRDQDKDKDRHNLDQARQQRERIENERHENEMKRNQNESRHDWKERQQQENQRHEENLKRIARDVLVLHK